MGMGVSFPGDEIVPKLDLMMGANSEHTKNHWTVHFKCA